MARISQAQQAAISVIAHLIWASQIQRNVQGMAGFEQHWLKKQTPHDRALVEFFQAELKRIPGDMAKMMEEERNGPST